LRTLLEAARRSESCTFPSLQRPHIRLDHGGVTHDDGVEHASALGQGLSVSYKTPDEAGCGLCETPLLTATIARQSANPLLFFQRHRSNESL
jgi:hypothetical protein